MTACRVSFLLVVVLLQTVVAFKVRDSSTFLSFVFHALMWSICQQEHEFKKCKDTGFCRRHRGIAGPKFEVTAESISVSGPTLSAALRNTRDGKDLLLSLKAYEGGFVRLIVDEDLTGDAARYRITPDASITMPEVEGKTRDWKTVKKDVKEVVVVAGDAQVSLTLSPFKVAVIIKGKPAVTLNGRGLFDFEHTRAKEVRGTGR